MTSLFPDHDRLFKELFSLFFREFIALFLPDVAKYLDDDFALVPMDKELFTDITLSDSYEVDLLMKAKFRGEDAYFLIHVENEAKSKAGFPKRMFRYFSRISETYNLPVYPVVVYSHDAPTRPEPNSYVEAFPGKIVLKFAYTTIQLNRIRWRRYLNNPNPVACALMAKMKIAPKDRPKVKSECLRMLMNLKLDPARTKVIGVFVDTYLDLTAKEMKQFEREMEKFTPKEKAETMEMMTSWERRGMEQGMQQGKEELMTVILKQRFSTLPAHITEQLDLLTSEQLTELGKALFTFTSLSDLEAWLTRYHN